jgi:hypothetical protein
MLASGVWLTGSRVRAIAVISGLFGAAMLAFLALAGEGTLDPFGQPIGTDFSAFWHAGRIANGGNPAAAWDLELLNTSVRATHAGSDFATAWVYPPVFLLVASPLAALPYLPALLVWQLLGVVLIIWALSAILKDRLAVLVCLASPLTPMVLGHGQNAFLTSALLGGGLLALAADRPGRAGMFGALACKPQLAVQVAPLLLFTRNWRAIGASLLVSAILIGASLLLWGADAWLAFIDSTSLPRRFMEEGAVGHYKSASLFSMARHWGASLAFSYLLQALGAVAGMALLWRLRASSPFVLCAVACAGIALSTPYLLDYDMTVVGLGAVFLYAEARRTTFLDYEKAALAYIWVAPWFGRQVAEIAYLPLLPVSMVLLAVLAHRRATEHSPAVQATEANSAGRALA